VLVPTAFQNVHSRLRFCRHACVAMPQRGLAVGRGWSFGLMIGDQPLLAFIWTQVVQRLANSKCAKRLLRRLCLCRDLSD
jgi:hypothetical protein